MRRSPFIVSITDLGVHDHRPERLTASVDWALDLVRVIPEAPLVAELDVQRLPGGLLVTGTVVASVEQTCHRCLDRSVAEIEVPVAARYLTEPDDESYPLESDEVDLEQMVRDETLLGLPLLPTCGPACPGVVSATSPDLNTMASSDDEDDEEPSTSPFAVLRDLLETDQ